MQNAEAPKRGDITEVEERRVAALLCADAEATVGPGYEQSIAADAAHRKDAEGHDMRRLLDINEILHRVLAHIDALANRRRARYPDTVIIAILFDYGNERLRAQALSALRGALDRYASSE